MCQPGGLARIALVGNLISLAVATLIKLYLVEVGCASVKNGDTCPQIIGLKCPLITD
jgi:hypothetical protein